MRKEFDELVTRQLRLPFDKVGDIEAPTSRPFGPLQRGAYGVILADPPWRFVTWSQTRQYKAPAQHYAVMGLDTIKALPVADLAAPDCLLLLWATQSPAASSLLGDAVLGFRVQEQRGMGKAVAHWRQVGLRHWFSTAQRC